ncbi:MAG TPA: IPT/TIG domain-containing protein, partial [Burkholderiales bacterium]|nr:IPT/TIG domain-containing protein [Burkholderiales bacterium]
TYTVGSSVQADAVAPYIGTTGKTGDVIIRGQGFAPATTVSFNGTPATTSSFLSDTEIHASYPATLIAGNNAVQLNNGAIPFTESLKIVDAPAYASTTLNYPSPPQQVRGLVYDAERKALLVGVSFADASTNQILRYAFASGAWPSTPTSATLANLRDLALSLNGSKLLAISDAAMAEADPVTLGVSASRAKPTATVEPEYLKSVVVANDGNAVITTGFGGGSGSTRLYLYSASQSAFSTPTQAGLNATKFFFYAVAGASADGAIVTIMESGLSSPQPVYRYTASTGILAATSFSIQHNNPDLNQNINAPAFDRAGSRMAVAQVVGIGSPFGIYDASFALLGLLPSTTAAYAVSPDGTRAYTVEIASPCQVRAFDLLSTPGGFNALTEIVTGFPITPVACPDNAAPHNIKMLVNPAGDTLFIAGNLLIAVVPLP